MRAIRVFGKSRCYYSRQKYRQRTWISRGVEITFLQYLSHVSRIFTQKGKRKMAKTGWRNAPTQANKRRSLGVGPTLAYPLDDSHAIRVFVKTGQCKCKNSFFFHRKDRKKARIMNVFWDKFYSQDKLKVVYSSGFTHTHSLFKKINLKIAKILLLKNRELSIIFC